MNGLQLSGPGITSRSGVYRSVSGFCSDESFTAGLTYRAGSIHHGLHRSLQFARLPYTLRTLKPAESRAANAY